MSAQEDLKLSQNKNQVEPQELRAVRDYIRGAPGSVRAGTEVDDIIRLAIASASRMLHSAERKPEVVLIGNSARVTPAFEQRIVALFGD